MFPRPVASFLSYPRAPSVHIRQKSKTNITCESKANHQNVETCQDNFNKTLKKQNRTQTKLTELKDTNKQKTNKQAKTHGRRRNSFCSFRAQDRSPRSIVGAYAFSGSPLCCPWVPLYVTAQRCRAL